MRIPRFAPTDQTRLPHHALDSLVIDLPALPAFGLSSSGDSHNQQRLCAADASPGRGTTMLVIPLPIAVEERIQLAHRVVGHQLPQPLNQGVSRYGWELMPNFF